MKTIHFLFAITLLFLLSAPAAHAQNCPNESFNFFDQIYLDQFILDYPDCEIIDGSVTITGYINNLDALSNIRVIKGDLTIQYTTELEDLSGLENLDTIYGNVLIEQNYLTSLNGIQEIESVGEYFIVTSNEFLTEIDTFVFLDSVENLFITNSNLTTLSGFSNLEYAYRLSLTSNPLLTELSGLSSLTYVDIIQLYSNSQLTLCDNPFICESLQNPDVTYSIENNGPGCNSFFDILDACQEPCPASFFFASQADLDQFVFPTPNCDQIRGNLYVLDSQSPHITDLSSLSGVTRIDSSLVIYANGEFTSLSALENLSYVGDDLIIQFNESLSSLHGLENVTRLGGDCTIASCQALTSLQGLNNLSYVGGALTISGNSLDNLVGLNNIDTVNRYLYVGERLIQTLEGLENLQLVKGVFQIEGDNLLSFDGIDNLTHIGGLHVGYNDKLLEMDALAGVLTITYDILVYENPELVRMPTLPLVDTLDGALLLFGNDKITNLEGFNNLKSINDRVEIRDMPGLTTLDGLENLIQIDGYLFLSRTGLLNLDGLQSLERMNGSLTIRDNDVLTSIAGIDQVDPATIATPTILYDLRITGNELLEMCSYLSICGVLQNADNIVLVEGNGNGCDSEEEVLAACVVGVHDIDQDDLIQVFPNPSSGEVNIELKDLNNPIESIEVYNMLSVKVYVGKYEKSFSFSSYSEGGYLMVFKTKDNQLHRKHVVVVRE